MLASNARAILWLRLRRVAGLVGTGLAAGTIVSLVSSRFIPGDRCGTRHVSIRSRCSGMSKR